MLQDYLALIQQQPSLFTNEGAALKIITDPEQILEWQNGPGKFLPIGIVLDDKYILGIRDLVEDSEGNRYGYIRIVNRADLKSGQSVAVIPIFQNKIVLIEHFRHATRKMHYEIPRGFGEPDTPGRDNAMLELSQEIGGTVQEENLIKLGNYHCNTGMESMAVELYYADLTSYTIPEKAEAILKIQEVRVDQLEQMIRDDQITDGFTIAAYTRAKLAGLLNF